VNLVIVDPAKTVKLHSADSAIVGVGVDREDNRIFVRDIVAGRMYPDDIYNEMFAMTARLKAHVLAVEVTSLNEFISQPIKNEIRKRGLFLRYVELSARAKKQDRIAQLAAYYRQGYIYHNRNVCTKLETQLLSFPRSKLWDVMDALAYVIELMDLEGEMFYPPGMDEDPNEIYDELDNEKELRLESLC